MVLHVRCTCHVIYVWVHVRMYLHVHIYVHNCTYMYICTHGLSNHQTERESLRKRVKALKSTLVKGGLVSSLPAAAICSAGAAGPCDHRGECQEEFGVFNSLQDGTAELKKSLNEVVDCWNIQYVHLYARTVYQSKSQPFFSYLNEFDQSLVYFNVS